MMQNSRPLLFLSRVAFICNIFFVLSALLQWKNFLGNNMILSTVIIIGYFMAVFLFSPLVNLMYLLRWSLRKDLFVAVPRWLVYSNFFFLLVQVFFIVFFLNGFFHH